MRIKKHAALTSLLADVMEKHKYYLTDVYNHSNITYLSLIRNSSEAYLMHAFRYHARMRYAYMTYT